MFFCVAVMHRMLLAIAFSFFPFLKCSPQGQISVIIDNFSSDDGVCIVCLHNNAETFSGKGKPIQCTSVAIINKIAHIAFENLPEGNYSILVIHDANKNNEFDKNKLGIPREGYGALKNDLPFASAPKFKNNMVTLRNYDTLNFKIRLRYLF